MSTRRQESNSECKKARYHEIITNFTGMVTYHLGRQELADPRRSPPKIEKRLGSVHVVFLLEFHRPESTIDPGSNPKATIQSLRRPWSVGIATKEASYVACCL